MVSGNSDPTGIYNHVLKGVPKEKSWFVKTPEDADMYDKIAASVNKTKQTHPNRMHVIPGEVPPHS